jgi:hypothetical protein
MMSGTTPAFTPLMAKKTAANAAGERQARGARTLAASASSSHGSSA